MAFGDFGVTERHNHTESPTTSAPIARSGTTCRRSFRGEWEGMG